MLRLAIIGNLGGDAEIKTFGNNNYISFNVAHSERDANGQETTQWISVLRYDNGRGGLLPYLKRGTKVYVAGSLRVNNYTDRNGMQRTSLDLSADVIQLCGGMPQQQQAQPTQQQYQQQYQQPAQQPFPNNGNPFAPQAGDLPF
ncbi:MAG: single-stranded DNA-binding protein [Bacteroidales bacterium]|nr:single-stranded DNA-binding protein [Bacteroidales bacterium]